IPCAAAREQERRLNAQARRPTCAGRIRKESRMGYKTILVHVDTGKRRRVRIDLACTLAASYGAHLVALFAMQAEPPPVAPEAMPAIAAELLAQRRAAAEEAGREFLARMRERDYAARSDWFAATGDGFAALQLYARHA